MHYRHLTLAALLLVALAGITGCEEEPAEEAVEEIGEAVDEAEDSIE